MEIKEKQKYILRLQVKVIKKLDYHYLIEFYMGNITIQKCISKAQFKKMLEKK